MNFSIRQLQQNDWEILKSVRLKALKTDPSVFGSNYQTESQMSDADWQDWLSGVDQAIFGVFEGDHIVGMTSVSVARSDPSQKSGILWGSWLEPHIRGKGVSKLMYDTRIDWARYHPTIEKILVSHRASNLRSKFANQKHGFVYTGQSEKTWVDGVQEDEVHYELVLKPI